MLELKDSQAFEILVRGIEGTRKKQTQHHVYKCVVVVLLHSRVLPFWKHRYSLQFLYKVVSTNSAAHLVLHDRQGSIEMLDARQQNQSEPKPGESHTTLRTVLRIRSSSLSSALLGIYILSRRVIRLLARDLLVLGMCVSCCDVRRVVGLQCDKRVLNAVAAPFRAKISFETYGWPSLIQCSDNHRSVLAAVDDQADVQLLLFNLKRVL